jgi:hypothetical protein
MRSRAIRLPRRPDGDRGAVAILTAMLALVLFGFAALAVELGDMYSRDAAVQTTADLAAFAGAQDLPNSCAAFISARDYLKSDKNGVFSDTDPATFGASDLELSDGVDANGEIEILDWDNNPLPVSPCSDAGHRVKVTTPTRTINFPLAGGLPGAPDSGTVQASAAVEVRSLDNLDVLPFSLPFSCGLGSQTIYDESGVTPPPSGTANFQPPGNRRGPWVTLVDQPSEQLPVLVTSINVSLSRLRADPSQPGPPAAPLVQFDFTLGGAPPVPAVDGSWDGGPVTPSAGNPAWFDATFIVPLPPTVQTTPGDWKVRAMQQAPGSNWYTRDSRVGTFTVKPEVLTSCIPTADPSGLFTSPRAGGGSPGTNLTDNVKQGIDHDLFPVVNPDIDIPCDADGTPFVDARLDDSSPTNGATCINVRTSSVATPTDGLIGSGTQDGRLVETPTVTTSGNCAVANDDDLQWTKNGRALVDTALSCYLNPTRSLANVKNGVAGSLTPAILNDPRFFVMPRTDTTFYPSNVSGASGGPQYWPIKDLVGAFITNETVAGGDASCDDNEGNECNGLVFNGSNLDKVQAFTFPLSALSAASDPANGRAYIGGPRDTLLVE